MKIFRFMWVLAGLVSLSAAMPTNALPQSDLALPSANQEPIEAILPDTKFDQAINNEDEWPTELTQKGSLTLHRLDYGTDNNSSEASYCSGGVGEDESNQMKLMAKNYALEVIFVQGAEQNSGQNSGQNSAQNNRQAQESNDEALKHAYIAEVKFQISDSRGNIVLDIMTEGPYLLANLPTGDYLIIAEFGQIIRSQSIKISAKKHQRLVFMWPVSATEND